MLLLKAPPAICFLHWRIHFSSCALHAYAAFLWCRIYRVYDFRVGNNVLVTSELVFTSRELVKKKAARVGDWLATFTLFPLSPVQKAGNNATDRVSCTNYFMSIEIIRCSVRRIKTTKPDKKNNLWQNHIVSFQYDATMRRCWVTARGQ